MNSSRLFSKTARSDFRRDIPWFVMYCIVFLFLIPVAYLFGLNGVEREYVRYGSSQMVFNHDRLFNYTLNMVGMSIAGMIGLFGAGFLEAYHEFGYLHRRNEIDFYHGLPLNRRQLFSGRFVNGLRFVLVPYILAEAIGAVCAAVTGISMKEFLVPLITGVLLSILVFLMVYVLAILAIMLTGRALTGILGMAVLSGYFPFISLCISEIPSVWFSTYANGSDRMRIFDYLSNLSPFTQAVQFASTYFSRFNAPGYPEAVTAGFIVRIVLSAAAVCAGIILCIVLYNKRPLEKAGEAMVFRPTERVIRILLVIAAAVGVMQFMRAIGSSFGWVLFFTLAAVALGHILVELIYRADAKKVFKHPVELALMLGLTALLITALAFDFFGYNRYLPETEKIAEARINIDMEYTWAVWNNDGYGNDSIVWYMDRDSSMKETDEIEAIRAIAKVGIDRSVNNDPAGPSVEEYQPEDERTHSVYVTWKLKNGRRVCRNYTIALPAIRDEYERLFDTEGYRHYIYPVLDAEPEKDIIGVACTTPGGAVQVPEKAYEKKIFDAYLMDVRAMTMKDIEGKQPCALLRFLLSESKLKEEYNLSEYAEKAGRYRPAVPKAAAEAESGDLVYWLYPVYDSFAHTKNALAAAGISTEPSDPPEILTYTCYTADEKGNGDGVSGTLNSEEDRKCVWKNLELYPYSAYNIYGPELLDSFGIDFYDGYQNSVYSGVIRTEETEAVARRCFEEKGLPAPDYE